MPVLIDSTPRTSACAPTSVAISPALPRSTVTSTTSRIRRAVSVRYAGGARTDGIEHDGNRALASPQPPARSIASTQCSESVPMFSTSAEARRVISSTSSPACAITGRAPSASVAFAVSFMTT